MYVPMWLVCILLACAWWYFSPKPDPHWSDDPEWRRELKQWRREQRRANRTNWHAVWQACRTDLWHKGDGAAVVGLLALAAVVIAVCR